jgi:hypothetical protein
LVCIAEDYFYASLRGKAVHPFSLFLEGSVETAIVHVDHSKRRYYEKTTRREVNPYHNGIVAFVHGGRITGIG